MAEKADDPCPCTCPELPQFEVVSKVYPTASKVLKTLHINKGILTAKECGKCASEERIWWKLTAIDIATKPPDVVQQALDVVREQSAVEYDWFLERLAELLKVLSTLYQEKMVTEQEVEELKSAVDPWSHLVGIQCTKPPDVMTRTAELLDEVGWKVEANHLRVLSTLYQEKMVTEQEMEELKSSEWPWRHLVGIQCTKPPDVVTRTAELLDEAGRNYEANCLRVLNELFNLRHIITEEECSEVAEECYKVPGLEYRRMDHLVLVLAVKPFDAVKEATQVMNMYDLNTQQLHVLSTLYQEELVTEEEVEELKPPVRPWSQLVFIQCTKPPDVVTRTAELLAEVGCNEQANLLRVLNELFNLRHIITEEECSEVAEQGYTDGSIEHLALVLAVKPVDAVKEATQVMELYGFNTQWLPALSELYQKKLLTAADVSVMREDQYTPDEVVLVQCVKPPEVVAETADVLNTLNCTEEATMLRVLAALYQKKVITQHDLQKWKGDSQNILLNLILDQYTKPPEDVVTTAEVVDMFKCKKEAKMLRLLSVLLQKKMIEHCEVEDMRFMALRRLLSMGVRLEQRAVKVHGVGEALCQGLVNVQSRNPPEVVTTTADVLDEHELKEEATQLRVLSELYQKALISKNDLRYRYMMGYSSQHWLDSLVDIQSSKSADVCARTFDTLRRYSLTEVGKERQSKRTDVTKDDPLKPLYSSSLKASEELPSSRTVKTLEEWRRLSERLLSKDSDPLESLHSSSLGMSKELPSHYAMKTLEEQGTPSEQPLMKETELASSLKELSVSPPKTKVSIVQAGGGSDPPEMEDTSTLLSVTKYDPLKPLYSSSEISEDSESLSPFTLHTLEGKMLSKQSLIEESLVTSSLKELSVSPPKTKVSSLQGGGGSDPPEMEDTSILLIDEAALKRLCWIPFGVKTLPIESQGGILYLQPPRDKLGGKKEDTIFVEVPPNAVDTSADVKMRYAIIPSGSFTLPEGYQLGSPVVYIYYDGRRVTKPLKLHLPHWYGGEDHIQDGLSFAIAPHSLEAGKRVYHFQLIKGGTFSHHQQYGTFHIDGHSSLIAEVFKEKATSVYLATQWEQRLAANETCTRIVITYLCSTWLDILEEYWVCWERNKTAAVLFQFGMRLSSERMVSGELPKVQGQEWRVTLVGSEVNQDDVCYLNRFTERELEGLVKNEVYPPAITCAVLYSSPRDYERPSLESFDIKIAGTTKHHVTFPIKVYSAVVDSPSLTLSPAQTDTPPQSSTCLWDAAALPPPPKNLAQCVPTGTADSLSVCSPPTRVISTSPDPLDERPTLKGLNEKVIVRVAGKWFTTGLQLDITSDTLDAIRTPNGSNREHCLEMFKCWLAGEQGCGGLPRTWSSVLHAVENGCGNEVCREIVEHLHKGT